MLFIYPASLAPEPTGGFVVTFRDWPEAITQGDTLAEALAEAADCLEEAVAARIDDVGGIPQPSPRLAGEHAVAVPIQTALKAALYLALRSGGISPGELAGRLAVPGREVERLLDPREACRATELEQALRAVGQQPSVDVRAAA